MRHPLRLVTVTAGLLALPAIAAAQEPGSAPATHTVSRGETLWGLAQRYLGDPFLWPAIYRLNTKVIEDPHWIYPGEVLVLPGARPAGGPSATPAGVPQRLGTVFDPRRNQGQRREARESLMLMRKATAVRPDEHLRAPYVVAEGLVAPVARITGTAKSEMVRSSEATRSLQVFEDVIVAPEGGRPLTRGDRLLAVRLDEVLGAQGQVVIPTAVVEVTASATAGAPARATIRREFGVVLAGQLLVPLERLRMPTGIFPGRVEFGPTGTITWVESRPVLGTEGRFVILSFSAADGIVPGDQVAVIQPAGDGTASSEAIVAYAQVTRVTARGASAVILDVDDGMLRAGMSVRVTAKMP